VPVERKNTYPDATEDDHNTSAPGELGPRRQNYDEGYNPYP